MQHPAQRLLGETDVVHGPVEQLDHEPVELAVGAVAGVHPQHAGLVTHGVAVGRRAAERLAPVGRQPLDVLRVQAFVAEGVARHRVGEAAHVPGASEGEESGVPSGGS